MSARNSDWTWWTQSNWVAAPRRLALTFFAELLAGLLQLMVVVDELDGLLEADGDEEAEDDGGDVDEEVAPGVGGAVGWVDVEQLGSLAI